jgi:hypothetical protein
MGIDPSSSLLAIRRFGKVRQCIEAGKECLDVGVGLPERDHFHPIPRQLGAAQKFHSYIARLARNQNQGTFRNVVGLAVDLELTFLAVRD